MNLKRSDLIPIFCASCVILLMGAIFLLNQRQRNAASARIACVGNLKQIGLAFRIWSSDCGDSYPTTVPVRLGGAQEMVETGAVWKVFQIMSNELSVTHVLRCPSDGKRREPSLSPSNSLAWLSLRNTNISYFVGLDAQDTRPNMFLSGDRNLSIGDTLLGGVRALETNSSIEWTRDIHDRVGNLGLADGSVMRVSTKQLRQRLLETSDSTNRVAFPQ